MMGGPTPRPADTWRCRYCMTSQHLRGPAPQTCAHCGAVETDQATLTPPPIRMQPGRAVRRTAIVASAVLLVTGLVAGGWLLLLRSRPARRPLAPIVDGSTTLTGSNASSAGSPTAGQATADIGPAQTASLGDTRIVTVTNPRLRVIPPGQHPDVEDLLRTENGSSGDSSSSIAGTGTAAGTGRADGTVSTTVGTVGTVGGSGTNVRTGGLGGDMSGPPRFDMRQLQVVAPRQMKDAQGTAIYLGEVINTSQVEVVSRPTLAIELLRHGQNFQRGQRTFPDLPPGARMPILLRFSSGGPGAFDGMRFEWKAANGYAFNDADHAHLKASVVTHAFEHVQQEAGGSGSGGDRSPWMQVTGRLTNYGRRVARNVLIFIVLRDASGRVTGYHRDTLDRPVAPGDTVTFDGGAPQWGDPATSVEILALPAPPAS